MFYDCYEILLIGCCTEKTVSFRFSCNEKFLSFPTLLKMLEYSWIICFLFGIILFSVLYIGSPIRRMSSCSAEKRPSNVAPFPYTTMKVAVTVLSLAWILVLSSLIKNIFDDPECHHIHRWSLCVLVHHLCYWHIVLDLWNSVFCFVLHDKKC